MRVNEAANAKLKRLERAADDAPLVTRKDATDDMVRALLEWLPASKRHPVASGMMRSLKSTEKPTAARKITRPGTEAPPRDEPEAPGTALVPVQLALDEHGRLPLPDRLIPKPTAKKLVRPGTKAPPRDEPEVPSEPHGNPSGIDRDVTGGGC